MTAQKQAIATALRIAGKYAMGGTPMGARVAERQMMHEGFLASKVPGRTDKLPISVGGGSYILPADHIAALGQGNSLSGADTVNRLFKMGPYGSAPTALRGTRVSTPRLNLRSAKFAEGGEAGATPIIASGGEMVIPPEAITDRFGDLEKGHAALDKWVIDTRAKHIKTLRGLKPPRRD